MVISPMKSGSNCNLDMLVYEERVKPEYPEKNLSSREENQQQTQPTYGVESENRSRATLVGVECSHHYTIPAPKSIYNRSYITSQKIILQKQCLLSKNCLRDCAIIIWSGWGGGGGAVKREWRAQCKLTALGRGVTCKFLGKWGGGGQLKN